jgi:hypothetical protein
VFRTAEVALAASKDYASRVVELDGQRLKVYKYHTPIDVLPHGM